MFNAANINLVRSIISLPDALGQGSLFCDELRGEPWSALARAGIYRTIKSVYTER